MLEYSPDAERELEERRRYLEQAEETRANNSAALESLASDLEGLRAELERARRAAALVCATSPQLYCVSYLSIVCVCVCVCVCL